MNTGGKRARTESSKLLTPPFRTDNYKKHHEVQHQMKWGEYGQLTDNLKRMIFDSAGDGAQTSLFEVSVQRKGSLVYSFYRYIGEVIVGKQLFHPYDVYGASNEFRGVVQAKQVRVGGSRVFE